MVSTQDETLQSLHDEQLKVYVGGVTKDKRAEAILFAKNASQLWFDEQHRIDAEILYYCGTRTFDAFLISDQFGGEVTLTSYKHYALYSFWFTGKIL
jgi:hypothetical protein